MKQKRGVIHPARHFSNLLDRSFFDEEEALTKTPLISSDKGRFVGWRRRDSNSRPVQESDEPSTGLAAILIVGYQAGSRQAVPQP